MRAPRLLEDFDAVVLAGGSEHPRDLDVPGRDLGGIHFAMDFLPQQNKRVAGDEVPGQILATGKHVVVLGGGDTGLGLHRHLHPPGRRVGHQLRAAAAAARSEDKALTWPSWPMKLRASSSHEEGCARDFAVATQGFSGNDGKVTVLHAVRLDWQKDEGAFSPREIPGSEFDVPADLVLLAMGYLHPVQKGMLEQLGVTLDGRGNVKAERAGTRPRTPRSSPPATCAAGSRWWCGPSARGARRRGPWTSSSWARRICRGKVPSPRKR